MDIPALGCISTTYAKVASAYAQSAAPYAQATAADARTERINPLSRVKLKLGLRYAINPCYCAIQRIS